MEHEEVLTPTATLAKRVREVRKRRGLTADDLAKSLAAKGVDWQRSTVAKLENGNRQNITLTEWLALASVLNVAPVHLLLPLDSEQRYEVTPGQALTSEFVRGWIRGHWPLPAANVLQFQGEMPEEEQGRIFLPPAKDREDRIRGIEASMAQLSVALQHLREGESGQQEHREEAER
ncbi:helix-turn-helix transcriptional regulator [Streptomyces glaucescens]|uniref:helix-turn-helix transcriptional regulator n=1 Tax=Streptomyces glaucescens TaxID=1907 RepID=UPI00344DA160